MKKIISLLLAAALCTAAAACTMSGDPSQEGSVSPASVSSEAESSDPSGADPDAQDNYYPVTIQNYNDQKEPVDFVYEKAPERAVCIWTNSVENMLALGLGDKIVLAAGVSEEEILPEYQEEFAKIAETAPQYPPKEDIVALEPDFILGWYSTFSSSNYWGETSFWNDRGVNTYISLNSGLMSEQTIQNELDDILALGRIFHVEDKAQEIVDGIEAKVEAGRAYAEGKDPVRVLILENEGDAFRNYGEDSIGGNIASQVGAEICEPDKSVRIGAADLFSYDPDVIFAVYFGDEEGRTQCVSDFMDNPAFASLSAVQQEKVVPIDLSLIYSPGVRVSNSVDYFLEHLYPEMES